MTICWLQCKTTLEIPYWLEINQISHLARWKTKVNSSKENTEYNIDDNKQYNLLTVFGTTNPRNSKEYQLTKLVHSNYT